MVNNKLKLFRMTHGNLTQKELAEKVGVSRQSIIAIENSKFLPSIELALKLARYFEVPVEDIFYLKE